MLNFSKNFVSYLDNYDKRNQTKYDKNLLSNIKTEFANNFKESPSSPGMFSSLNSLKTDNSLNEPDERLLNAFQMMRENTLFESTIFKIPLKSAFKTESKEEEKEEKEKEKVEIKENIEELKDLLDIIEKYDNVTDFDYNIDVKQLNKIKPELISLEKMIGIKNLKQNVLDQLLYFIQNLHISDDGGDFKHTVIYGPPGTGKTEIAKIIGKMYSKIGVLKENRFVKVSRQDLIAGYLGQTAIKTAKVIQSALGGVLFIDEAYSLASSEKEDSFSKECLDTLCESLSNYKGELMVIIAGYEEELDNTFFKANKGLNSRFIWRFKMEPYDSDELLDIFKKIVDNNNWLIDEEAEIDKNWFKENYKDFTSYGRDMEQLFTYTKICHSRRIYGKDIKKRKKLIMEDIKKGFKMFSDNRKKKEEENKHIYSMYL
tara:strand:- start:3732 stop:5018 length:1287 start_codon:yes stop_codon:yes gene_type:complete